uniref:Uncharacterized protein n=1 Tax=Lepeophtheirus salmonis TaxID=72036 RepID=A0A0K2TDL6_LEPSM
MGIHYFFSDFINIKAFSEPLRSVVHRQGIHFRLYTGSLIRNTFNCIPINKGSKVEMSLDVFANFANHSLDTMPKVFAGLYPIHRGDLVLLLHEEGFQ